MTPYVFKNEIIQCPCCNLELYKAIIDLYLGDIIRSDDFISLNHVPTPKRGDIIKCIECGALPVRSGKPYIKGTGWLS